MDENKIQLNTLGAAHHAADQIGLDNGVIIEVSRTIPYEELFEAIDFCLPYLVDERGFVSAPLLRVVKDLSICRYFTNLDTSFLDDPEITPKEIYENYDLIAFAKSNSGESVLEAIKSRINASQYGFFEKTVDDTIQSIVKYYNSARGIIDTLADSSKQNSESLEKALAQIEDPEIESKVKHLLKFYIENS